MMITRTIGRLRYDDPSSDFIRDFQSKAEALDFLNALGFVRAEEVGQVTYFYLPGVDAHSQPVKLAGYLVETKG